MMVGFSVRRPSFSKDFSSETIGPISIKFHMQSPGKMGNKVYKFGPGSDPLGASSTKCI